MCSVTCLCCCRCCRSIFVLLALTAAAAVVWMPVMNVNGYGDKSQTTKGIGSAAPANDLMPANGGGIIGGASSAAHMFATRNNTRVIAQRGGLAILPCAIKWNPSATVSWIRRRDFQLLTVGLSTYSSDERFLIEHARHAGHWSLRIKSVRDDDRGWYECQLSIHPIQSIYIELRVVEAVADIIGAPDVHIDEGSQLRLECLLKRATESPTHIFWYHNGKMINYDQQSGYAVQPLRLALNHHASDHHPDHQHTSSSPSTSPLSTNEHMVVVPSSTPVASVLTTAPSRLRHIDDGSSGYTINTTSETVHHYQHVLSTTSNLLTIAKVRYRHGGNYTCAPSNARPISVTVHVLRNGEQPAAMQHGNRSISTIGTNCGLASNGNAMMVGLYSVCLLFVVQRFIIC